MKITDLKVGMKVRAIDDNYYHTNKRYEWVGIVTYIAPNGCFNAKTLSTHDPETRKNEMFSRLNPEYFEPIKEEKKITTMNEVPLKVTYAYNTVYVIYKGEIVAKATCNQEDHFNEEFGLNLALRRFCKTLCDENTTKKVIYNTDKVEDFI